MGWGVNCEAKYRNTSELPGQARLHLYIPFQSLGDKATCSKQININQVMTLQRVRCPVSLLPGYGCGPVYRLSGPMQYDVSPLLPSPTPQISGIKNWE